MTITYEKYEIEADAYNFILHKRGISKKGNEKLYFIGHFSKLRNVIRKIIHLELAEKKGVITLKGYLDRHQKMLDDLSRHIKI